MTLDEAKIILINRGFVKVNGYQMFDGDKWRNAIAVISKWLEQQPCEMTVEEYRQRMIDAFHNADCDNLIALVALPTEKEFEHLEWLLKNHYHNQKQQSCEDCISRQAAKLKVARVAWDDGDSRYDFHDKCVDCLDDLSPVTPKEKTGRWIFDEILDKHYYCSECKSMGVDYWDYCPNCGAKMKEVENG